MRQLRAVELVLAYDQSPVVCDLSLTVPDGRIPPLRAGDAGLGLVAAWAGAGDQACLGEP